MLLLWAVFCPNLTPKGQWHKPEQHKSERRQDGQRQGLVGCAQAAELDCGCINLVADGEIGGGSERIDRTAGDRGSG